MKKTYEKIASILKSDSETERVNIYYRAGRIYCDGMDITQGHSVSTEIEAQEMLSAMYNSFCWDLDLES